MCVSSLCLAALLFIYVAVCGFSTFLRLWVGGCVWSIELCRRADGDERRSELISGLDEALTVTTG